MLMVPAQHIVGHERVRAQLAQQTANAVMLEGPSRVGRRVLARWFAQYVNCRTPNGGEPCGTCPSCLMFAANTHPDYLEVGPKLETRTGKVARVNLIPIGAISASHDREREHETHVTEWLETAARERVKVVVFDGAEYLNESAANALLKTIEEPPHGARFVFITEDSSAVMPTIVSRSVRVRVPPVADLELERALANLEPELDLELLGFAHGRPGIVFDRECARDALKTARGFLEAVQTDLLNALTAADGLEKHWDRDFSPQAVMFLLRDHHASVRLVVDRALLELIESLEGYVTPSLVFAVFALELRRALGFSD
jgi:DNA polymerase-3 subunit delta'